jgi:predicted RNA-binding Zn-ribbon protein involved in translation (DUF1610 family)
VEEDEGTGEPPGHDVVLDVARRGIEGQGKRPEDNYSYRACPKCGHTKLLRQRPGWVLRALNLVGIRLRRYTCDNCGRTSTLKRLER